MSAFFEPCDQNVIRSRAAAEACTKSRGRWILAATILASSMAFIDGTVVNVALPALQTNLGATAIDVQWVVEAYSLFLSALLLVGGSLGDHYGRRHIFLLGVIVFALASAGCGFAGNIGQLIAARAVQGIGAALLVPGSLAIISSSFAEEARGRAIGTWSGFSAITAGIGPVLGGWLIEHVSWRAAFFINVPIALLVLVISLRHVSETSDPASRRIDWLGAALAASAMGSLVYALIESSRLGFHDPSVVLTLSASIFLVFLFFFTEARAREPMLPLKLFRSATFTGANLLTFFLYAALSGTFFFLPLNLIQIQHYSPTAAGGALLPFILIMFLLSRWAGGLVHRYGSKIPLSIGPLVAACGYFLFLRPGIDGSYWTTFFPPVALLGVGMAISVAPLTTTVMDSVAESRAGLASGVNNAVARSAGLIAVAVLGIVMLHVFRSVLDLNLGKLDLPAATVQSIRAQSARLAAIDLSGAQDPSVTERIRGAIDQSFISGFRVVTLIGGLLAVTSALTAATLIRKPPG